MGDCEILFYIPLFLTQTSTYTQSKRRYGSSYLQIKAHPPPPSTKKPPYKDACTIRLRLLMLLPKFSMMPNGFAHNGGKKTAAGIFFSFKKVVKKIGFDSRRPSNSQRELAERRNLLVRIGVDTVDILSTCVCKQKHESKAHSFSLLPSGAKY